MFRKKVTCLENNYHLAKRSVAAMVANPGVNPGVNPENCKLHRIIINLEAGVLDLKHVLSALHKPFYCICYNTLLLFKSNNDKINAQLNTMPLPLFLLCSTDLFCRQSISTI